MITVKKLKAWVDKLDPKAKIGIDGSELVASIPSKPGWEDLLEVGELEPEDDED